MLTFFGLIFFFVLYPVIWVVFSRVAYCTVRHAYLSRGFEWTRAETTRFAILLFLTGPLGLIYARLLYDDKIKF